MGSKAGIFTKYDSVSRASAVTQVLVSRASRLSNER